MHCIILHYKRIKFIHYEAEHYDILAEKISNLKYIIIRQSSHFRDNVYEFCIGESLVL